MDWIAEVSDNDFGFQIRGSLTSIFTKYPLHMPIDSGLRCGGGPEIGFIPENMSYRSIWVLETPTTWKTESITLKTTIGEINFGHEIIRFGQKIDQQTYSSGVVMVSGDRNHFWVSKHQKHSFWDKQLSRKQFCTDYSPQNTPIVMPADQQNRWRRTVYVVCYLFLETKTLSNFLW